MMRLLPAASRTKVRRAVRLPCQVVDEARGFVEVARLALDLSPDGMLVECDDERVGIGDELLVSFRAPRSSLWIDAAAFVARVVHGRRRADHGRCLGLRFLDFDPAMRAALASTLEGLPPPVPARRTRVDYAGTVALIAWAG
jgi:hypothetical protein